MSSDYTSIPSAEFYENEQARIQGPIIATWALMIIACILRFIARRLSKAGLWYDDWLMIPALVFTLQSSMPQKLSL